MIEIFNTQVFGFEAAIRGQRNPMDSWAKGDSNFTVEDYTVLYNKTCPELYCQYTENDESPNGIGLKDLELCCKLTDAGEEHRKAIRMIQVWATWILPRYVWTEADTYRIGMTRMSCSTMHKLGSRLLNQEDFAQPIYPATLDDLNADIKTWQETKSSIVFERLKNNLPEGFLQRADVNLNYETCLHIFGQRKNHRLKEWRYTDGKDKNSICNWMVYSLPYFDMLAKANGLL